VDHMTKRGTMPKDTSQRAASIVAQATADRSDESRGTKFVFHAVIPESRLRTVLHLPDASVLPQSSATE
jgi:hypothetical protein